MSYRKNKAFKKFKRFLTGELGVDNLNFYNEEFRSTTVLLPSSGLTFAAGTWGKYITNESSSGLTGNDFNLMLDLTETTGATTLANTGTGDDATVLGTPTFGVADGDAYTGNAITVTAGNTGASVANLPNFTSDWSVGLRFKATQAGGVLFQLSSASNNYLMLWIYSVTPYTNLAVVQAFDGSNVGRVVGATEGSVIDNMWYHALVSYVASTKVTTLFINGVKQAATDISSVNLGIPTQFRFGIESQITGGAIDFNGNLSRLYKLDKSVSDAEGAFISGT